MANPASTPSKSQLRKALRQTIRESAHDSAPACAALEKWLRSHPALQTIAVYSPLPGEVDFSQILQNYPLVKWIYPRIQGHHLTFHPGCDLIPGTLGIHEPAHHSPEIPLLEIDAFICPGLAFDPTGHRLGRGRGFYDRLLAQARPDALKIGICFPFQIVPDTLPEPHDIQMDTVLF